PDSAVIADYLAALEPGDFRKEENIRFIVDFSVIRFKPVIGVNHPVFEFMYTHRPLFEKYYSREIINSRIIWIANNVTASISRNDTAGLMNAIRILHEFDTTHYHSFYETDGRSTSILFVAGLDLSL